MVGLLRLEGVLAAAYFVLLAVLSARWRRSHAAEVAEQAASGPPRPQRYAFLVPCHNEALVLEGTLDSLMALPAERTQVLVIDDASTDGTGTIAASYPPDRVQVLRRELPDARLGKGAALNAGLRHLREGLEPPADDLVVAVVDGDGHLPPAAIDAVDRYLADPRVGAVQLGVRIRNRHRLLTRFQDLEFVSFSSICQAGRMRLGSVALGGNGQFSRLSALTSLGEEPWSDCLAEDLDLGLRLLAQGWRLAYADGVAVEQQGVTDLPTLMRQRTRWQQGHLQCWARIPTLLRASPKRLRGVTLADLLWYLIGPAVLAATTFPLLAGIVAVILGASHHNMPTAHQLRLALPALAVGYATAAVPGLILARVYQQRSGDCSWERALLLVNGLIIYNFVWYVATWRAAVKLILRRKAWAKTGRSPELPSAARS